MRACHLNQLWAQLLIEELTRCGVTTFCVAPGSRSTPLALAIAENTNARSIVHFDERGSSFYALGFARATGRAAAVVCTSGTAVANLYPAIVEAHQSGMPLVAITADRPPELQDTGALQTINQPDIFGRFARWSINMPTPDLQIDPAYVLTTVDQAVFRATSSTAGPVHLNCMYREPLAPTEESGDWNEYLAPLKDWLGSREPYTAYTTPKGVDPAELSQVSQLIGSAKRGIIVVGPLTAWRDNTGIIRLASQLGMPIFADINSGLRHCGATADGVLCHHDLFLRSEKLCESLLPDCVLQFGGTPISKSLQKYMTASRAPRIVINDCRSRQDIDHRATHRIDAEPNVAAIALANCTGNGQSAIVSDLVKADRLSGKVLADFISDNAERQLELAVAAEVFLQSDGRRAVYLATSMPIRDAEASVSKSTHKIPVAANRGANGIDGTIASAVGFAEGLRMPVTLVIGDLALLHDLNSLSLIRQSPQPITIVLINNNGGGIFSFLPIAKATDYFDSHFGVPHGMTFAHTAEQFGISYSISRKFVEFRRQYADARAVNKPQLIEVVSDRQTNRNQHEQLWERVTEAAEQTLLHL